MSKQSLSRRVQRGELVRVHPRVYRSTLVATSLREAALGAVLWAGDGAVASHTSAARIFGAGVPTTQVHVLVPNARRLKSNAVAVHRGFLTGNDRRIRDRVPVTSPARTLVDLAGMLDSEVLEATLEDFLHRGLTTPMAVQRCLDSTGGTGRAGSHLVRALLAQRDEAPLESRLEVKLWRLLRAAGLHPVRQHVIQCDSKTYRLDFAWPVLKVAVECEGFAAHGGRRAFDDDRKRLAALVAAGWVVIPMTWKQVADEPDAVISTVAAALLRAA